MQKLTILALMVIATVAPHLQADDATSVSLVRISQRTWLHTSFANVGGYRVDSHGLVIDTVGGAVLVDTCWNPQQTDELLGMISRQLHKPVIFAIITHAHIDRIGGIEALERNGIKVVSTPETNLLARAGRFLPPSPELDPKDTVFREDGVTVEVYYPGPGHTKDNMVVWVAEDKVLFGGCLIRSMESTNLGNVADADVLHWVSSVQDLERKFPHAEAVVPGHGSVGTKELLKHTIELCPRRQRSRKGEKKVGNRTLRCS